MKFLALGEIVEILDSKRKPISKKDRKQGPYPYYGATGIVDYIDGYIFDEELVLVGEDGAKWKSMDNTAFTIKGKTWVNNHAHVLRPNNEIVLNQFLIYYLNFKDLSEFVKGITVPKLNQTNLKLIPIPVPSLQDQEKIVERLEKVFENIDKKIEFTNKQIINFEILINSQLKNIFENKENMEIQMRLEDITEKITDGKHGDCENQDQSNFYFLSAKNIKDGKLLYENARQITKKDFEETHKRTDLKPGDLLITNSGTIGRMAIAEENEKTYKTTFQKSVAIVKPNHNLVNNEYLFYYLKNKIINLQNISRGAAQKNLLLRDLRNFIVNLPDSVKSQINTVKKLDSFFSKTKEINILYQNKLNLLATLKKSILDKEFFYE